MLFNSFAFLVFLATFLTFWPAARGSLRTRLPYLAAFSFFFYGWWGWQYLVLLICTAIVDYYAALAIVAYPRRRHVFLAASMLGNLGTLAAFKYSRFLAETIQQILCLVGWHANLAIVLPPFLAVLPPGISFYTFQSMSYTIEVYRGELKPTKSLVHFFSFVTLFPHLVAGPILRARYFLPLLLTDLVPTEEMWWEGLRLILHGFFKKLVIADNLAPFVNDMFARPVVEGTALLWWTTILAFAFQIYCDFSGYTDIARGVGLWIGYPLPENFRHPYLATSFKDFWGRWHISLSTWFRDYVYIPLGGTHKGAKRAIANMWVTMLLSGLWHGAAWHFVVWGAWHALLLTLERVTDWSRRVSAIPIGNALSRLFVFVCVLIGWVFFRADSMDQALAVIQLLLGCAPGQGPLPMAGGIIPNMAACMLAAVHQVPRAALLALTLGVCREISLLPRWTKNGRSRIEPIALAPIGLAVILVSCIFLRGPGNAFIYFQF